MCGRTLFSATGDDDMLVGINGSDGDGGVTATVGAVHTLAHGAGALAVFKIIWFCTLDAGKPLGVGTAFGCEKGTGGLMVASNCGPKMNARIIRMIQPSVSNVPSVSTCTPRRAT